MNMRRTDKLLAALLLAILGCGTGAYAQVVDIPDPNLRAAIQQNLNLTEDAPITRDDMRQLVDVYFFGRDISDLSGIEFATELRTLDVAGCKIADISPLANLTQLTTLNLGWNRIADITPLANLTHLTNLLLISNGIADISPLAGLTKLKQLRIQDNAITDIRPLAALTQLTYLALSSNQITDVSPLAGLTQLEQLHIQENAIVDYSPLDGLSLTEFVYDQTCDVPPLPLQPRLENRSFPSVFTAWGGLGWSSVLNQPHLSDLEQMAQHDLYWCCLMFGGDLVEVGNAVVIRGSLDSMVQVRDDYIAQNPNMIFLAGLSAVWEGLDTFPPDSDYWLRDEQGEILPAWDSGLVNLNHPEVQKRIIDRAIAVSKCGFYDGIFFDGWSEWHSNYHGTIKGTEAILKGIRERVREDFLIVVNTNTGTAPVSAPYINGLFLESGVPGGWDNPSEGFTVLENTLSWAEKNLRNPQVNALEGWAYVDEPLDSPANLRWMRAITTLSLTFSDSYVLFMTGEWKGEHMHWHYWHDFWDADLGRPVGPKSQLYDNRPGLYIREFTNGWAVYNHSGKPQVVTLPEKVQAVGSGLVNIEHALPNLDGEMYLRVKPANPADVNGDGMVNIFDLTLVAHAFGTDNPEGDVNGDGMVNIFDLVIVAEGF